jgi:serine/threonine protein kinase
MRYVLPDSAERIHVLARGVPNPLFQIKILKTVNHPNVVRLFDVLVSPTHLYLVMELITGGELFLKLGICYASYVCLRWS